MNPQQQQQQQQPHIGITCDDCGVCPIVGTRYISRQIHDFDVCSECIEAHDASQFASFDRQIPWTQASQVCPLLDNFTVHANSVPQAIHVLQNNPTCTRAVFCLSTPPNVIPFRANTNDTTTTTTSNNIAVHDDDDHDPNPMLKEFEHTLSNHPNLTYLRVHSQTTTGQFILPNLANNNPDHNRNHAGLGLDLDQNISTSILMCSIARGVRSSLTLKRFIWLLEDTATRSQTLQRHIQAMLQHHTVLQSVQLIHDHNYQTSPTLTSPENIQQPFIQAILTALETNTSLTHIRIHTKQPLSSQNKCHLFEILTNNRSNLTRIHINMGPSDYRLDFYLQCKIHGWLQQFTNPNTLQNNQIDILLDVIAAAHTKDIDPVYYIYQLLRAYPSGIFITAN